MAIHLDLSQPLNLQARIQEEKRSEQAARMSEVYEHAVLSDSLGNLPNRDLAGIVVSRSSIKLSTENK